jgi:hypothetical protein
MKCLACDGANTTQTPSSIAPFVAHRAGLDSTATMTVHCTDCGCRFSSVRLDDKQNAALYAGYRGTEYTEQRESFEPGYTKRDAVLDVPRDYLDQVDALILGTGVQVRNVLDVGGSSGHNTPLRFASRTIYDLASRPGQRAADFHLETQWLYDVVVLSHVLEHVPNPRAMVRECRAYLNDRGVIYAEVPDETPRKVWHEHMTQFSGVSLMQLFDAKVLRYRHLDTALGPVHMVVAR